MFLFLSKSAKVFLNPENQVFFCAILSIPWALGLGRNWRRIGKLSVAWLLILFSPAGTLALRSLERGYPLPRPEQFKGKTALVLGGYTVLYDTRRAQMDWGVDSARVQEPLRLFRQGLLKRLVFTGGPVGSTAEGYLPEAASIAMWWEEMGVPKAAIALEETSRNTHENFERVRPLLQPGEEVVLFTSAYHLRRSMAVARKVLPNPVTAYPVGFKADGFDLCSWENVINARRVIFELTGILAYRLAGFSS